MALCGQGTAIIEAAKAAEAQRRAEEAEHPEILDKYKSAAAPVAGVAVETAVTVKTQNHHLGRAAGRATKAAVESAMEDPQRANKVAVGMRDAVHTADHVMEILAGPFYMAPKALVKWLWDN